MKDIAELMMNNISIWHGIKRKFFNTIYPSPSLSWFPFVCDQKIIIKLELNKVMMRMFKHSFRGIEEEFFLLLLLTSLLSYINNFHYSDFFFLNEKSSVWMLLANDIFLVFHAIFSIDDESCLYFVQLSDHVHQRGRKFFDVKKILCDFYDLKQMIEKKFI